MIRKTVGSALAIAGALSLLSTAVHGENETFAEDFSNNPLSRGWRVVGHSDLFEWNPAEGHLRVTWDSSKPNSYFHRPLGTILTRHDDFSLAFDLAFTEIAIGTTPEKPFSFQATIGFLNLSEAAAEGYFRASGTDSPNLAEFNYFPDAGFGATVAPVIISTDHQFAGSFNFPFEMTTDDLFRIEMRYTAQDQTLATTMTRNGEPFGPIENVVLTDHFSDATTDFRLDHIAIKSYSDEGQHPDWGGSILARGVVDNISVTTPAPAVQEIAGHIEGGAWHVQVPGRTGWMYVLERTTDWTDWAPVGEPSAGAGEPLTLTDDAPLPLAFYRVRAERL